MKGSSAARLALFASLLRGLAACSTTAMNTGPGPQEPPPPVSTTPDQTNQPAAGFENVKPGSEEDFILNVSRRTFFAADSAALDSTARTTLDNQAAWLKQYPQWLVKLQGFADDSGSEGAQVALSQKRANSVMFHLNGVANDPELDKKVGLLWLGNEFAQLSKSYCSWTTSRPDEKCDDEAINRSAFVSWVDCRL